VAAGFKQEVTERASGLLTPNELPGIIIECPVYVFLRGKIRKCEENRRTMTIPA
jgi:hypothetical protein